MPSIRELMRGGHARLKLDHLAVFILMQRVVTTLRGYTITIAQIGEVHEQLFEVMCLMTKLFPHHDGSVSPNMHMSMHLKQMLLDFGPPAGWWCMQYERFNHDIGNLPRSGSCPAESSARRALRLIACAQTRAGHTIPLCDDALHDLPFTHAYQVGNSGSKSHRYSWRDVAEYQLFQSKRVPEKAVGDTNLLGNEPFPGVLRHSRRAPNTL